MRTVCAVPGCCSGSRKKKKIRGRIPKKVTLFGVPKNADLFEKWNEALPKDTKLTKNATICELHFREEDIERFFITKIFDGSISKIKRDRVKLKQGSVPCIFSNQSADLTQDISEGNLENADTSFDNISDDEIRTTDSQNVHQTIKKEIENENENFLQIENVYHMNGCFTYFKLLQRLHQIKKPTQWWCITPVCDFITCVRWNNQFAIEKRVVIDQELNVKIFLKERQIVLMDHSKVDSIDDVSSILAKVEIFGICVGASDKSHPNCLACLPFPNKFHAGRRRMFCKNCSAEKRRLQHLRRQSLAKKDKDNNGYINERLRQKLYSTNRKNTRLMIKVARFKQTLEQYKKLCADGAKQKAMQNVVCNYPHSQQESVQVSADTFRNF